MVAIMSAAMLMSSVTVSMAFPVGVYAEELADNLEGQTTSIGYGDTMKNNWGTILSNEGTLSTNHMGGTVSGGNVTENYGTATDVVKVDNNYNSGTVTGSDSQVTNNFGTVNGIGQVTHNYGTAIDTSVENNYSSGIVKQVNSESVNVEKNYGGSIEGPVSVDATLGENAGPDAIRINQQDPKPVSPAGIRVPQPDSETNTIIIDVKPDQPSIGDSVEQSLIKMINEQMNTKENEVIIDFKQNTFVTKDMLKALIKDNSKDVYCKFTDNGKTYILRIPKGHKLTADVIDSIFAKQKDTAGAGFLTIQNFFADYNLQVETEDNTLYKAVSIKSGASAQADVGIARGREVYDPKMNTWNWLDANANRAKARDKIVWIPYIYQEEIDWYDDDAKLREMAAKSDPGMRELVYQDMKNKKGKWLRYDQNGKMLKGWVTIEGDLAELYPDEVGNTYYYDTVTGTMAKGVVTLNGVKYSFNEITGALER